MTRPMKRSDLALRPSRTCRSCGRSLGPSELLLGDPPICAPCLFGHHDDGHSDDGHRGRVVAILAERYRIGQGLGNCRAVRFPDGIDLRLRDLIDDLRRFLVAVRVELRVEDGVVVARDGHLRRTDDSGGDGDYPQWWPAGIGFYVNPDDEEPHATLAEHEYARIIRIGVIDRMLTRRSAGPHLVWEATEAQRAARGIQRARGRRREWCLAVALLAHVLVVLAVVVGGFVPFFVACHQDRMLDAAGWGLVWWFGSVVGRSSLGVWHRFPRPSALWREDDSPDA